MPHDALFLSTVKTDTMKNIMPCFFIYIIKSRLESARIPVSNTEI